MSGKLFWYKKEAKYKEKEKGEDGKEKEIEKTKVVYECFSLDHVIRGLWHSDELFMVLLDDGHEQSVSNRVPIFNKGGTITGYEMKRERDWYYSQIELCKEDAERFRVVTEAHVGIRVNPDVIASFAPSL